MQQYETPRGSVSAISWVDNTSLSVSTLADGMPLAHVLNMSDEKFVALDSRWQAVFAAPDSDRRYAVETRTNKIFLVDKQFREIKELAVSLDYPIDFNGLQLKSTQNDLVYAKSKGMFTSIHKFNVDTEEQTKLGEWLYVAGFDVRDEQLILSYEKSRTGDVMRTHLVVTK